MGMKVFDLACDTGHRFEGWFASGEAFDDQSARGLIECPICASHAVRKLLSAPRLNLGASAAGDASQRATALAQGEAARERVKASVGGEGHGGGRSVGNGRGGDDGGGNSGDVSGPLTGSSGAPIDPVQFQKLFLQMTRHLLESTEDVGSRFAEEARKIHYAEAPERAIRGQATREEAAELRDEGIEVFAVPIPKALKGPLQ